MGGVKFYSYKKGGGHVVHSHAEVDMCVHVVGGWGGGGGVHNKFSPLSKAKGHEKGDRGGNTFSHAVDSMFSYNCASLYQVFFLLQ